MWQVKKGTTEYFSFCRNLGSQDDDFERRVERFLEEGYYDSPHQRDKRLIAIAVQDGSVEITAVVEIPHVKLLELARRQGELEIITDFDIPLISEKLLSKECRRRLYDMLFEMGGLKKQKDVYLKERVGRFWNSHSSVRKILLVAAILVFGLLLGGVVAFFANNSEQNIWLGEAIAKTARKPNVSNNTEETNDRQEVEDATEESNQESIQEQRFNLLNELIANCPIRPRSGRGFDARSDGDGVIRYTYQHLVDVAYYYGAGYRGPFEERGQWVQANEWVQAQTGHDLTYFAGSRENRSNLFTLTDIIIDSRSLEGLS